MGTTYIPNVSGQVPTPQGPDTGIVQLALAIKQQKMAETRQKKEDAQQMVQVLLQNPQLMVLADPKELEKGLKEGYGIKITDQPIADPSKSVMQPPKADAGGGGALPLDPNALVKLSGATQGNKGGAQAANQPSPNAGNKAPGGGVEKVGNPQLMESLAAQAHQSLQQKFGALAPLYGAAMSQIELEQIKAKATAEIESVKMGAAEGNFQMMGRLMQLSGKNVTDADMRAMIASSNMDPTVIKQAMDFALGNETDQQKAQRFSDTIKTLGSTPSFMGKLNNPLDLPGIARSIVYSGRIPEGIDMKPLTLDELDKESEYEKYLVTEVGLPYDTAHTIARGRSFGLDTNLSLPKGFHTLAQRKVGATEVQAAAAKEAADADMLKAQQEGFKIKSELSSKKYDILNERLRTMIEADKSKHSWPDEVKNALINQVAVEAGLTPEEAHHWYSFISGQKFNYLPNPDVDLAKQAAGKAGVPKFGEKFTGAAQQKREEKSRQKTPGTPLSEKLNPFSEGNLSGVADFLMGLANAQR